MRAFIVTVGIIVILFFAATQMFLPSLLEARVGEGLEAVLNGAPVQVHVSTFPAFRMLTGAFAKLDVNVQNFHMDGLQVADLRLEARNLDVDVRRVFRGETLPVRGSERFTMEAVITEDALTDFVNAALLFPGEVGTELSPTGVRISGDVALVGNVVPVVVIGRFEPSGESGIAFIVDDLSVQGTPLPAFMLAVLKEAYAIRIDLNEAPLPLYVDEIVHESGRIIVRGRPQPSR